MKAIMFLCLFLSLVACKKGNEQSAKPGNDLPTPAPTPAPAPTPQPTCNIGNYKDFINKEGVHKCDLSKANFQGAKLQGANLSGADLRNTRLNGADLREVSLTGAKVTNEQAKYLRTKGLNGFVIVK